MVQLRFELQLASGGGGSSSSSSGDGAAAVAAVARALMRRLPNSRLVPAARQRALCVPPRPAAGRSRPSSCPTTSPRRAPSAPRPERSGWLERLHASCARPGSESSALARRIALALPPAPCGPGRRHQAPRPSSVGPCASGGGQRGVGGGASDDRRRPSSLLVAGSARGGARRRERVARESRRGSWMSLGGHPLDCAMRVSALPMSCAHVRRCLEHFKVYRQRFSPRNGKTKIRCSMAMRR
jgi:hypothetical protein